MNVVLSTLLTNLLGICDDFAPKPPSSLSPTFLANEGKKGDDSAARGISSHSNCHSAGVSRVLSRPPRFDLELTYSSAHARRRRLKLEKYTHQIHFVNDTLVSQGPPLPRTHASRKASGH